MPQQSLATLKKRVGADYVLSGSYLVSGAADTPSLRIDLALQDAASGKSRGERFAVGAGR